MKLIGNSSALAYLACLLAESGIEVEWQTTGFPSRLRPLVLSEKTMETLRGLFRRNGGDTQPLLSHVQAVTELGGSLRALAKSLGVKVLEDHRLAIPVAELGRAVIVDADSGETRTWPEALQPPARFRSTHWVNLEMWLSEGEAKLLPPYAEVSGVRITLEPHPYTGVLLSLFAPTRLMIDRALKVIRSRRENSLSSSLQALFLMNPQCREASFAYRPGPNPVDLPGVFPVGQSIGTFPPFFNVQGRESFAQVERLAQRLLKLSADERPSALISEAESWKRNEQARFRAAFSHYLGRERELFSRGWRRYLLRMKSTLPRLFAFKSS